MVFSREPRYNESRHPTWHRADDRRQGQKSIREEQKRVLYKLRNARYCPRCGATQKVAAPSFTADSPAPATNNTLAIVGFVVALISLLINFWGIVGIAATILSVLGYLGCKQKNQKGKGLAIAGIVIGAISVVWAFISLMALAVM